MNRRHLLLAFGCLLTMPQVNVLCAAPASDPLIATLQAELGVTPVQATSGVGALLSLVRHNLPREDFTVVSNAIQNSGDYLQLAESQQTATARAADAKDFVRLLQERLGIESGTAARFAPVVIVFVAQVAGDDAGELLVGALGL